LVAGSLEAGNYQRDFPTEQEAREFMRDLKGKPVAVHYNPNKSSSSRLLEGSLDILLRNRAPISLDESVAEEDAVPGWARPLLWTFIAISVIGLVLSLWVHLGAVMGRQAAPAELFWILHVGVFVVFLPAALAGSRIAGKVDRKYYWKLALKHSPEWMRYMMYGFFGYSIVNFLFFLTKAPNGSSGPNPPAVVWRGFSGHWMAFYSAAFAILYSAAQIKRDGWRCPNGHLVPMSARWCERCVQPPIGGRH
jgi:hypothetical protein